jgi:nitrate reductase (NAD(P)H)
MTIKAHLDRRWTAVKFLRKRPLSEDTKCYTFGLPSKDKKLGLETGQHLQIGFHFKDRLVVRPYTPTRPILESEEDGTFDLVVKTYFPSSAQPGGTMSNILDCLQEGEEVEVKGPAGEIRYRGNGEFRVDDKTYRFDHITLILGGSGITPGYQLIARILRTEQGKGPKIRAIDANKSEDDILMRGELDKYAKEHPDQFQITYVLSHPADDWKGEKGHVNEEILHKYAFEPGEKSVALLCGPPTMIQKAVLPVLKKWGYDEDKNLFGF